MFNYLNMTCTVDGLESYHTVCMYSSPIVVLSLNADSRFTLLLWKQRTRYDLSLGYGGSISCEPSLSQDPV